MFPTLDEFLSLYEAVCLIGWDERAYRRTEALQRLHAFVQAQMQVRGAELIRTVAPFLRISAATLLQAARSVNLNHNKAMPIVITSFLKQLLDLESLRWTPASLRAI